MKGLQEGEKGKRMAMFIITGVLLPFLGVGMSILSIKEGYASNAFTDRMKLEGTGYMILAGYITMMVISVLS